MADNTTSSSTAYDINDGPANIEDAVNMNTTDKKRQQERKVEERKVEQVPGLSLDDVTGTLKLVSKDNKEFEVERKFSFVSTLVKTSLDTDGSAKEVPIPGVSAAILAEVVTYMNHHKGVEPPIVEKPLRSKVMKDVCKDPFDAEFIDRIGENRQALYDLILAANYMDMKSLLHLGCAKVASLIKGQPLEKIKDILSTGAKDDSKNPSGSGSGTSGTRGTSGSGTNGINSTVSSSS